MAATPLPLRDPSAGGPDPASLLQAAIRERDASSASRLLQQWVHRRGLGSLERFRDGLAITQGTEACAWLAQLVDVSAGAPPPAPVEPVPAAPLTAEEPVTEAQEAEAPVTVEARPAPAAEAEPAGWALPDPQAEAGESAPEEPLAAPLPPLAQTTAPLTPPPSLSEGWTFDLDAAFPSPGSGFPPTDFSTPSAEAEAGPSEEESPPPASRSGRRRGLGRIRGLMREALEEARGVLHRASSCPEAAPAEAPAAVEPAPLSGSTPSWMESPAWAGSSLTPAVPPAAGAPADPAPASGIREPLLPPTSPHPAPAPPTLADLRSWLPQEPQEPEEPPKDLPRAS
ncbi:MAG: hypothetical protein VKI81_04960 [Synechococcaceae cyanobacterium]|nr:hypothetical protein [Synechococcaceae cyanobacterium]